MYTCERCGSGFSPIRIGVATDCPRCRARDGVAVPLIFTLVGRPTENVASTLHRADVEAPATPHEVEPESE
jgi:hypothetical protein